MEKIEITLERGDHYRLEKLHEKVKEAVVASGVAADVRKGASAGGMSVQGEPEMKVCDRRVARPEAMTVAGMAELLRMAAAGELGEGDGAIALPFGKRFRATGREAEVAGAEIAEVVDDATGVLYLLAGGSLCPLLHADGSPQRMR